MPTGHRLHAGDSERETGPWSSGNIQPSAKRNTDNDLVDVRFTFVISVTSGDSAVMECIVGTKSFSGAHFLRDKLMGLFILFLI